MSKPISVLPDISTLSDTEREVLKLVFEKWPTSPLEIAEHFNEDISTRESKKRSSTKYAYYLKKLVEKKHLVLKRTGNSIIVWPLVVEKYRTIHSILQDYEKETLIDLPKEVKTKSFLGGR